MSVFLIPGPFYKTAPGKKRRRRRVYGPFAGAVELTL
jgi:hypothetical protein